MTAIWNGNEWVNAERVHDARDQHRLYLDELRNLESFIDQHSQDEQPSRVYELRRSLDKVRRLNEKAWGT